ncbi:hypothetical protein DAPPUDRAFT_94771 [Daphnia pulex]|uniref:Uncharacterized protein n=1 Tax=Daphnia pulex TaxID=6669 RepID=E9FT05_DAPPU|nr:hypothetical protein DAPPUDRAFT_94768 [Daphnia pulex]EFX89727.1 hypothetical protein DAPPUDRAFT_94771 [Daphnia pulex]|eukprot:EFX89286.1 hypothetical protein DAPPUDRAFT_94768 [Daphnia pulex]
MSSLAACRTFRSMQNIELCKSFSRYALTCKKLSGVELLGKIVNVAWWLSGMFYRLPFVDVSSRLLSPVHTLRCCIVDGWVNRGFTDVSCEWWISRDSSERIVHHVTALLKNVNIRNTRYYTKELLNTSLLRLQCTTRKLYCPKLLHRSITLSRVTSRKRLSTTLSLPSSHHQSSKLTILMLQITILLTAITPRLQLNTPLKRLNKLHRSVQIAVMLMRLSMAELITDVLMSPGYA